MLVLHIPMTRKSIFRNCVVLIFLVHYFQNKDNFKNRYNQSTISVQKTVLGEVLEKTEAVLLHENVNLVKKKNH